MVSLEINKDKWVEWLKLKGLSERTIIEYNAYFDMIDFTNFTQEYILTLVMQHNACGLIRATVKNVISFIKSNDYPMDTKMQVSTIEIPQRTGRVKRKLPNFPTIQEVFKVANHSRLVRNKYMILVCFFGALRLQELLRIRIGDFKWVEWLNNPMSMGELRVIGKGNKQRVVFLPMQVMAGLYDWLKEFIRLKQFDVLPFKIARMTFRDILSSASIRAIGRHINPHSLRHGFASYSYNKGLGLRELQEFLGHASISTTQIYTHITPKELKQNLNNMYKDTSPKEQEEQKKKKEKEDESHKGLIGW